MRRLVTSAITAGTSAAVVLLVAYPTVTYAAGAATDSHAEAARNGRWGLLLALVVLTLLFPVLLAGVGMLGGKLPSWSSLSPRKMLGDVLVGQDGRLSTSKTVALVWTYAVAAALLSFVVTKWLGYGEALEAQGAKALQTNYAVLVGGPVGAALLAKVAVTSQVADGAASKPAGEPTAAQLISGDTGSTSLGDLQYVIFNTVALVFFFGELLRVPYEGLPDLPDLLVGLTGVAAIGYLGNKVVRASPSIVKVEPESPAPGDTLRISGPGLVVDRKGPKNVLFGDRKVTAGIGHELTTDGPVVRVTVPPDLAPGSYRLAVTAANDLVIARSTLLEVVAPP